jgi:hypothetical protein
LLASAEAAYCGYAETPSKHILRLWLQFRESDNKRCSP